MTNCTVIRIGDRCTGCEACVQLCPTQALSMKQNEEGFYAPFLQESACIGCGKCLSHCPVASPTCVTRSPLPDKGYAGSHRDTAVLMESASGGAFSALVSASSVDQIYGMTWDTAKTVSCLRCTPENIAPLRKSKYVQGRINGAYRKVQQDLKQGLRVLYSGTPCQIAGLYAFLGYRPEGLITVEILCHGVGSPGLFADYCTHLELWEESKITDFSFRKKSERKGEWEAFHTVVSFENGKTKSSHMDKFTRLFLQRTILRSSCGVCPFADCRRVSDLVLGDYWGCRKYSPALYKKHGVSVVIPITGKGKSVLEKMDEQMTLTAVSMDSITAGNCILLHPQATSDQRAPFFHAMKAQGSLAALLEFAPKPSWKQAFKRYLCFFFRRFRG